MFDLEILKGKNAFISGATGGIGKAIAIHLAKSGCNLFLTSTDDFSLEKLSKELLVHNVGISYISANISNDSINLGPGLLKYWFPSVINIFLFLKAFKSCHGVSNFKRFFTSSLVFFKLNPHGIKIIISGLYFLISLNSIQ